MNRCKALFVRVLVIGLLGLVIAMSMYRRSTDPNAVFGSANDSTSNAAVALRSLSGGGHPDKSWIDDFSGFTTAHPGQWIVGRCAKPCLSQSEAQQTARSDAARAVYSLALGNLGQTFLDQTWLARRVLTDVQEGKLASDELPERFDRPYGTIWTDTVLLDASAEKLNPLVDRYRGELRARSAQMKTLQIGAALLALFTWLVYFLANTITRRYFTLRLQLIAGTITAMALLVLLGGP